MARWSGFSGRFSGRYSEYVPVAARRQQAERRAKELAKKGQRLRPVVLSGRTIASTFWGVAWCSHLERYSDYANRLPRGRTYARNGSVMHLEVGPGRVSALVSGSQIYGVDVRIKPLSKPR